MNSYIKKLIDASEDVGRHMDVLLQTMFELSEENTSLKLENEKLKSGVKLSLAANEAFNRNFKIVSGTGEPFTIAENKDQLLIWHNEVKTV